MKSLLLFPSKIGNHVAVQYAALSLVFLRVVWPMWQVRDITFGDTSSYYLNAVQFAKSASCIIAWSPLYTSFLGSFLWINPDPYFAVIAHRIVILAIATVGSFEIGRRILAPPIAWLTTVWWLALPITHDTLYEVHLFSILPILLIWGLLVASSSMRMRGICAGLFIGSTLLVRNELVIAGAIFISLSVLHDFRTQITSDPVKRVLRSLFLYYGIPAMLAAATVGVFYYRSTVKYPELSAVLKIKHTLNVSQIYAFGYGQRHPEYTDSPWVSYQKLMVETFGNELPTMREATVANPKAMVGHFTWNVRLIPSGLQLALFNCRGGGQNPDYAPSNQRPGLAWTCSALCLLVITATIVLWVNDPAEFRRHPVFQQRWFLTALVAVCFTTLIVMIMQRPRPSYMFPLSLALIWLVGLSLEVLLTRIKLLRFADAFSPAIMVAALWIIPTYGQQHPAGNRPLFERYQMLRPLRDDVLRANAVLASPSYNYELSSYLGLPATSVINLDSIVSETAVDGSLAESLRTRQVRVLLFAEYELTDDRVKRFLTDYKKEGWQADRRNNLTTKYQLYTRFD